MGLVIVGYWVSGLWQVLLGWLVIGVVSRS